MSEETPRPTLIADARTSRAVTLCMQFIVSWMCVGGAVAAWHARDGGAMAAPLMWLMWGGVSVETTTRAAGTVLMLVAVAIAMRPNKPALYMAGLWFFVAAVLKFNKGGDFARLTPLADAARYVAPLAMTMLLVRGEVARERLDGQAKAFEWMLRIGAAATFIGHGAEAFKLNPEFVPLIVNTGERIGMAISENAAHQAMRVIGAIDILVAGMLLAFRWRTIAAYMAVWGFATALSRMTAYGFSWTHETLIRLPNGGLPLVLLVWWQMSRGAAKPAQPESAVAEADAADAGGDAVREDLA